MTGCRHGAKNTLVKNYLHLAERAGAPGPPRDHGDPGRAGGTAATASRSATPGQLAPRGAAACSPPTRSSSRPGRRHPALLHRMKAAGELPRLSDRLGTLTSTNSRRCSAPRADSSVDGDAQGVAITSSFHPDAHTHIEPVRYGDGSNAMGCSRPCSPTAAAARAGAPRCASCGARPPACSTSTTSGAGPSAPSSRWSCRAGQLDHPVRAQPAGGGCSPRSQGHGEPNPTWSRPAEAARRGRGDGRHRRRHLGEPFDRPLTAHFIGGCAIGASAERV